MYRPTHSSSCKTHTEMVQLVLHVDIYAKPKRLKTFQYIKAIKFYSIFCTLRSLHVHSKNTPCRKRGTITQGWNDPIKAAKCKCRLLPWKRLFPSVCNLDFYYSVWLSQHHSIFSNVLGFAFHFLILQNCTLHLTFIHLSFKVELLVIFIFFHVLGLNLKEILGLKACLY